MRPRPVGLIALATAVDGVLAGASLDRSIKQLPARHRIGVLAFSAYSQASNQANGIAWYAALGVGGALLTLATTVAALRAGTSENQRQPLVMAAVLSVGHTLTTARAAPINFSQRSAGDNERAPRRIFDHFERWQAVRAGLQLATFLAMLCALAVS
jgi:hypothetical protein